MLNSNNLYVKGSYCETMSNQKASICISKSDSWKNYDLVCRKTGRKDGYDILHPTDKDDFSSIRVGKTSQVSVLKDGELEQYELERIKWWDAEYEVQLFGASDDLIEVRGDIREEFYANFDEPTYLRINEAKVNILYDGEWKFWLEDTGDSVTSEKYPVDSEMSDKYRYYSELLCVGFNEPVSHIEIIED